MSDIAGGVAVLIGGGAFLAFGAATADGGADSPEAALELALAAVADEDIVALAELMEPSERSTLFEAGFDFVDELVRLDVLDDDMDMSAIDGIDLELTGFEPQVERPGNDLAHIYLGTGVISGEVDVAQLPLGQLVLDRLDTDQQTFTDSGIETTEPTSTPLVAVERDGRWYLSLWYTVAENARLDAGEPLPDLLARPAAIGGDTPEAPVRLLFEELAALDFRRMIGALDPEEMAVLYDYAPLFLDEVEPATNAVLEEAREAGWAWQFDELTFTTEELASDLARVNLQSVAFSAASATGSRVAVAVSAETFSLEAVLVDDFFGETVMLDVTTDGDCVVIELGDGVESSTERVCADDIEDTVDIEGLSPEGALASIEQVGFVTREVDGTWYVSPIRTGLDAMITAVEQLDPETLAAFVDEALGLGSLAFDGDLGLPGVDLGGADLTDPGAAFESIDPVEPFYDIANDDLLADDLNPAFAWDLDPDAAQSELGFWVPDLVGLDITRAAYATVAAPTGGDVAIVSVELGSLTAARDAVAAFVTATAAVAIDAGPNGGDLYLTEDVFGDPVLVEWNGDRLVVIGVYGASLEEAQRVLAVQFGRS